MTAGRAGEEAVFVLRAGVRSAILDSIHGHLPRPVYRRRAVRFCPGRRSFYGIKKSPSNSRGFELFACYGDGDRFAVVVLECEPVCLDTYKCPVFRLAAGPCDGVDRARSGRESHARPSCSGPWAAATGIGAAASGGV